MLPKTTLLNFGLTSLFLITISFSACRKDEVKKEEASLKLTILDANGDLLSGATVEVYSNQKDWDHSNNPERSLLSDQNGVALFDGLDPVQYFITVRKGCENNHFDYTKTENFMTGILEADKVQLADISLSRFGYVSFTINNEDWYQLFIDGEDMGAYWIRSYYPSQHTPSWKIESKSYTFRIVHAHGQTGTPLDSTFVGQVPCGGFLHIKVP